MAIVLIAIGLLFTGVDFMVGSGISYPEFYTADRALSWN